MITIAKEMDLICALINFFDKETRRDIGSLRHKVFVENLEWISGDKLAKIELDYYDPGAQHVAVYLKNHELISYARILKGDDELGMMINNDVFKNVLPKDFIVPEKSIEVSRFALNPNFFGTKIEYKANFLIFQSIFQFAKKYGYENIFAIADGKDKRGYSHKDYLLKKFRFEILGKYNFREETATYGMMLSRNRLEEDLKKFKI